MKEIIGFLLILLQVAGGLSFLIILTIVVAVRYFGYTIHLEYLKGEEDEDNE